MTTFDSVILEVSDPTAAEAFYRAAGLDGYVSVRGTDAPTTGFRGFALSPVASQPGNVDAIIDAAVGAGATVLKPATKSFWGYGGVIQAPDGTVIKVATSQKKDTAPASRTIDQVALLLGVADVKASKRFYVGKGLAVAKSFGARAGALDVMTAWTRSARRRSESCISAIFARTSRTASAALSARELRRAAVFCSRA